MNRRTFGRCALPVLALLSLSLVANAQDVARMRDAVRQHVDDNTFMGSVLVARDGEVLLSEGYGFANLEWNVPNTPTTKFRLGSITKQFTAAAILLLAERGKLSIDDPIKKHMPNAPATWDSVTIYHVLTHTSGIPSFTSFPEYMTAKLQPSPAEKTVALFKDRPLDFAPGSQMSYSNSGYVLLGYLVEKISGQSYAAFLRDNIFTPLGMKDTGYDVNAEVIERRAAGYTPAAKGGFQNAPFVDMTIPGGAGALYSTTEDLLRWTRGLFGGKLLTGASVQKMTTPFKNNYAFGLVSSQRNGRTEIAHNGGIEGFNTKLMYYPVDKTTFVVLANVNSPAADQIADQLAAVYYGVSAMPATRNEVKLPLDVLAGYAGVYPLAPNFVLTMTVVDGALISRATGQPDVPLYAEAKDKFFARAVDATIEFVRDADGRISGLTLRQGDRELHAPRQ